MTGLLTSVICFFFGHDTDSAVFHRYRREWCKRKGCDYARNVMRTL